MLTCTVLLRAGHPPLRLTKPHAARFLNDSTLLTVYENGDYQPTSSAADSPNDATVTAPLVSYDFVTTPAQRRLPTAFVTRTSGRVLRRFFLKTSGAATNELLRVFGKPAQTYFLCEENTKLVLVPKAAPDRLAELPLKTLAKFKPPLRSHEKHCLLRPIFYTSNYMSIRCTRSKRATHCGAPNRSWYISKVSQLYTSTTSPDSK